MHGGRGMDGRRRAGGLSVSAQAAVQDKEDGSNPPRTSRTHIPWHPLRRRPVGLPPSPRPSCRRRSRRACRTCARPYCLPRATNEARPAPPRKKACPIAFRDGLQPIPPLLWPRLTLSTRVCPATHVFSPPPLSTRDRVQAKASHLTATARQKRRSSSGGVKRGG